MVEPPKRRKLLSLLSVPVAVLAAAVAISACGSAEGGDGDGAVAGLASWMPADSVVYVEGTIRPEGELADNVDQISTRLTGESLDGAIEKVLDNSKSSSIDFKTDVEPWLGASAALALPAETFGDAGSPAIPDVSNLGDLNSGQKAAEKAISGGTDQISLVAETTDPEATQSFIGKQANENGQPEEGEYEGVAYTVSGDGDSVLGVSDELLLASDSLDGFKAMVDAHSGDSLDQSDAFSELSGKAPEGSLANLFLNGSPLIGKDSGAGSDPSGSNDGGDGSGDSGGGESGDSGSGGSSGTDPLYKALGVDPDNAGVLFSLVPGKNEISVQGASTAGQDFANGDPGPLLETFPAGSVFAIGSAGVGENLTRLIDAVNQEGIEGLVQPGELNAMIEDFSRSGIDLQALIESLDTAGLFVSGDSVDSLGGALVVTSSDLKPLENSLSLISTLFSQSRTAQLEPLGGGVAGFRVSIPDLPGRPVTIAVKGDRLVIAIGRQAARQALNGGGQTLAGSKTFQAAVDSLNGEGIDMFADPAAVGKLIRSATRGGKKADQAVETANKFEYVAGGGGDGGTTFEFNFGLGS